MSQRPLCTEDRGYAPIPQDTLDAGWNKAVHVENWPASFRFTYVKTRDDGAHVVASSRGQYVTRERLMYTKRYQPSPSE